MSNPHKGETIKILLVDDIAETRESIKKLLDFEKDFIVVGSAGNGRDGVEQSIELKPDIVLMDINMPDMDGLEAASRVTKAVPTAGVIMMSVQDDPDYMQKAMLAGARFFLSKPVSMDQLYNTIRSVYAQYAPIREQMQRMVESTVMPAVTDSSKDSGDRAGHIIAVYSPQGGAGCTTIATNLASGLMKEDIKTLMIDADLEFGDVGAFLDLRAQTNLADLAENVHDMDMEYVESVIITHNSGMKVLLGPTRPAIGAEIRDARPDALKEIINFVAGYYDFIIVDVSKSIDVVTASILEMAHKIVLVCLPTLPSIKNVKLVLDMFDQTGFLPDKTILVVNKAVENPNRNQRSYISAEKIQAYLKRPVEGLIPLVDEIFILNAINKGVPVIASDRDTSKAPIKQLLQFSDHMYTTMFGIEADVLELDEDNKEKRSWLPFGNR